MANVETKYFFRQSQRNRLYSKVVSALEGAARSNGIKKKDIASKLEVNPSQVSRWLSGPANWTIDTVSDLLWAIKGELDFDFVRSQDRCQENYVHPLNLIQQGTPVYPSVEPRSFESLPGVPQTFATVSSSPKTITFIRDSTP